jgi:hypothetical protein
VGVKPVAGGGEVALELLQRAAGVAVVAVGLGLAGFGGLHGLAAAACWGARVAMRASRALAWSSAAGLRGGGFRRR